MCKNPPLRIDGTELAQMALSAIARMNESEGQAMVIDVLRGCAVHRSWKRGMRN